MQTTKTKLRERERQCQQFEQTLWDVMEKRDLSADRALTMLTTRVFDRDRRFFSTEGFELCAERMGLASDEAMRLVRFLAERSMRDGMD